MNYFDDENKIIDLFQGIDISEIYYPQAYADVKKMLNSVHNPTNWKKWINSAGKNDPPPDFYSDKYKYMMDVMRVDDHSFINPTGKVENPTNARESKIQREIRNRFKNNGIDFSGDIIINAYPGLPTLKDHNYSYYFNSFKRVLAQHNKKIELYKKNHPGYKIIFFVMDESSAYTESAIPIEQLRIEYGEFFQGEPHIFYQDKRFVDVLLSLKADYLIWFAPFKLINTFERIEPLPKVIAYNLNKYKPSDIRTYNLFHTISCEA